MADVAAPDSMDAINAQRIAAGLAPIDTSGAGEPEAPDEDEVAAVNFAARREEMRKKKEEEDIKERIAKYVQLRLVRTIADE